MCVWVCVQSLYKAQPLSTMLQLQTPLHEDCLRQTNEKNTQKTNKNYIQQLLVEHANNANP